MAWIPLPLFFLEKMPEMKFSVYGGEKIWQEEVEKLLI
nr:MAG TPA: hypothetical protein [Caudoviricetes sp.]